MEDHKANGLEHTTWKLTNKKIWMADGTQFSMYLEYIPGEDDTEYDNVNFRDFSDICWEHEVQKAGRCIPKDYDERVVALKELLGEAWEIFSCKAYRGQPVMSHPALKFASGQPFRLIFTTSDGEAHDEDSDVYCEFVRLGLLKESMV